MLKKIFVIILLTVISIEAKVKIYESMAQENTKEEAIQVATWKGFENALMELLGEDMEGSVINSFKKDMEKDFGAFKRKYMDFSTYDCQNLKDNGFYCEVKSNINFRKLRSFVKRKSNDSTSMGRNNLADLDIAIINNVSTKESESFLKSLISAVNRSGNNLYILDRGAQVGRKGNNCTQIEKKLDMFKRKGSSYRSAVEATERKLRECQENKNMEYAFSLDELTFKNLGKTSLDEYEGILTCEISMLNSQNGRRNKSIESIVIQDVDSSIEKLKLYLYKQASVKVSEQLSENMYDYISTKNASKKMKKIKKNNYMYTIILMGLTNDSQGRGMKRVFKNGIKKMGYKIRRNSSESTDFEQVYNFGTNEEIDIEELMDNLYDLSDSTGIPIQISEDGNNILNVQFQ